MVLYDLTLCDFIVCRVQNEWELGKRLVSLLSYFFPSCS